MKRIVFVAKDKYGRINLSPEDFEQYIKDAYESGYTDGINFSKGYPFDFPIIPKVNYTFDDKKEKTL